MYILTTCPNVNVGKIYLEKIKIKTISVINENEIWLTKKNGNSWGI